MGIFVKISVMPAKSPERRSNKDSGCDYESRISNLEAKVANHNECINQHVGVINWELEQIKSNRGWIDYLNKRDSEIINWTAGHINQGN